MPVRPLDDPNTSSPKTPVAGISNRRVHSSQQAATRTVRQQRHIPALDGIRGFAVLAVVFYHYAGGSHSPLAPVRLAAYLFKAGWAGVTLFFTLSGFLITGILWDSFDKPHWIRNFYARRTLRILPLYYLALAILLAAAALAGTLAAALRHIWIPVLFLQNLPHLSDLTATIPSPLTVFHFWSLAVEEQFYLIWPFLLVLQSSRRSALRLCLAVFVLSLAFRILVWTTFAHPLDYWQFLPSRAGELSLGGALAILYRGPRWPVVERWAPLTALLALIAFTASSLRAGTPELLSPVQSLAGLPAITLLCVSIIALALRPGIVQQLFSAPWLRWIGSLSYGIYVYHVLLGAPFHTLAVLLCGSRGEATVLGAQFLIVLFGSVVVAWLSFRFFETPFLKLKRRYPSASST